MSLDKVSQHFRQGESSADIVCQFPAVDLADVHHVFAWMLRHGPELDDCLSRREAQAAELRDRFERSMTPEAKARQAELKGKIEALRLTRAAKSMSELPAANH